MQWYAQLKVGEWLPWQGFWIQEASLRVYQLTMKREPFLLVDSLICRQSPRRSSAFNVPCVPNAEAGHKRLISQYIRRLCAADEANLLDEEDMHIYGLMPMEDPLHLVCCNACKKPVKASQYATHSEFCRLLSYGETILEVNGGAEQRKPPRKERKKLIKTHSYKITIAQKHKRSESIKGDDTVASESHLDYQVGTSSFISIEDKNMATKMDYSGGSPGLTDQSGSIIPAKKRYKGIADDPLTLSDDLEAVCGGAEVIQQEETACREFPNGSVAGIKKCHGDVVDSHKPVHIHESCLPAKYIPAPLATKMFYSQRNNRLRSAISLMYHGASTKDSSEL